MECRLWRLILFREAWEGTQQQENTLRSQTEASSSFLKQLHRKVNEDLSDSREWGSH